MLLIMEKSSGGICKLSRGSESKRSQLSDYSHWCGNRKISRVNKHKSSVSRRLIPGDDEGVRPPTRGYHRKFYSCLSTSMGTFLPYSIRSKRAYRFGCRSFTGRTPPIWSGWCPEDDNYVFREQKRGGVLALVRRANRAWRRVPEKFAMESDSPLIYMYKGILLIQKQGCYRTSISKFQTISVVFSHDNS